MVEQEETFTEAEKANYVARLEACSFSIVTNELHIYCVLRACVVTTQARRTQYVYVCECVCVCALCDAFYLMETALTCIYNVVCSASRLSRGEKSNFFMR